MRTDNLINGEFTPGIGDIFQAYNPFTGEKIASPRGSNTEQVDAAVNAAQKAIRVWRKATPAEFRVAFLAKADPLDFRAGQDCIAPCRSSVHAKPDDRYVADSASAVHEIIQKKWGSGRSFQSPRNRSADGKDLSHFAPAGVCGASHILPQHT